MPQLTPVMGAGDGIPTSSPDARTLIADLFEQHRRFLAQYLRARGVQTDDLADLMQETFERFHRHAARVDPARARPLLTTIARNLVIDRVRHQRVSATDPEVDVAELMAPVPSPEQALYSTRELEMLNQAIEQLPGQCRRVFVMRKIHQMSQKAIAEKLGISVSTVEKHVAAGMRMCKQRLAAQADNSEQ